MCVSPLVFLKPKGQWQQGDRRAVVRYVPLKYGSLQALLRISSSEIQGNVTELSRENLAVEVSHDIVESITTIEECECILQIDSSQFILHVGNIHNSREWVFDRGEEYGLMRAGAYAILEPSDDWLNAFPQSVP